MIDMLAEDFDSEENMRVTRERQRVGMPHANAPFQSLICRVVV